MVVRYIQKGPVGYDVVGSPTIVDGVVSGFGESNYLKTSSSVPATSNFEFNCKITTGTGFVGENYTLFVCDKLRIGYTPEGYIGCRIPKNGTYAEFQLSNSIVLKTNTTYTEKVKYDGNSLTLSIYDANNLLIASQSWQDDGLQLKTGIITIGYAGTSTFLRKGELIDLNNTYIKVNGQLWFGSSVFVPRNQIITKPTDNTILLDGEPAYEKDTNSIKVGNGEDTYEDLPYLVDNSDEEWCKPKEWVDIRNGALPNSMYLLVGHTADYSKYRYLTINATVSTAANTYDVFVDGIKQFTTASGSDTAIDWQTLNLDSGFNVTYPEALKTHIVRVTPTTSSDTFSAFRTKEVSGVNIQGCLWMHVTASNTINYEQLFGGWQVIRGSLLEAVTTSQETLKGNNFKYGFTGCKKLIETPVFEGLANQDMSAESFFSDCQKIKKIKLKNFKNAQSYNLCYNCNNLQDFITENCEFMFDISHFNRCFKLKNLPSYFRLSRNSVNNPLPYNAPISDCIIDLSKTPATTYSTQFVILNGSSTNKFSYLKGLILNDQMSLTSTSTTAVDVAYTGMERWALIALFNSLPTVSGDIICKITGATGAADLTADDLAIATNKGWTVTR